MAVIILAAALRVWPLSILGGRIVWLTFYPAVTVAAAYGGFSADLLAAVLSIVTAVFFCPLLVSDPFIKDFADWLGLAFFS